MDRLHVRPAGPLHGEVRVDGAKNSVLKLMVACLLAPGTSHIEDAPNIADVGYMGDLLQAMGCTVEREEHRVSITTPEVLVPVAPYELVEKMRASFVVLGPLLARAGEARVALPGGDDLGSRPIDFHLRAFTEMGAELRSEHGDVVGRADRLTGARIVLEYPSHTTTDNVLMAAVLAKGTTVIENAAREPEIQDLAAFLAAMGAHIEGAGTSRIVVEGVEELRPATHRCVPDRVEAATFLIATAIAGGEVRVRRARAEHMHMLLEKLVAMGVDVEPEATGVLVRSSGRLRSVDIATLPYPGFATDYKAPFVAALSVAEGVAIVSENLFGEGRFRYTDELRRMGADIRTEGHHAVVRGVPQLSGAPVRATDIRAGAALVLAGLVADGETVLSGVEHIDRGYHDFVGKLAALGADIERISDPAAPASRS